MTDTRPVLVVTSLHDPTADVVIRELHDRGVPVVRFDSG
ncbi:ATP-grasp ribosomal peptide maturase, partial [Streptomyces sp. NPDC028722]